MMRAVPTPERQNHGSARGASPTARAGPVGVCRPRASPLYRLLDEQFRAFTTVYDERFAHRAADPYAASWTPPVPRNILGGGKAI